MIKLIAADLDGTLLNSKKEVSSYTEYILKKCIERGIVFVLATGRTLAGIPEDIVELFQIPYGLTANGARITDLCTGESLHEDLLGIEEGEKVLSLLEQYDTFREVYFDGIGYARKEDLERIPYFMENPYLAEYIRKTRKPVEDVRGYMRKEGRGMDKVQGIFHNLEERDKAFAKLMDFEGIVATESLGNNIEINRKGVNKGRGLQVLGEKLGISLGEMIAFGDGANDIEMIQMAGVGFAMGNAIPSVQRVANYIGGTNDEDGIGRFLASYLDIEGGRIC